MRIPYRLGLFLTLPLLTQADSGPTAPSPALQTAATAPVISPDGEDVPLEQFKALGYLATPGPEVHGMSEAEKTAYLEGVKARLYNGAPPPLLKKKPSWLMSAQFLEEWANHYKPFVQRIIAHNREQEDALFAQLAKDPTLQQTESGLFYQILVPGDGPKPKPGDIAVVDFRAMLIDGTVFTDTYVQGESVQLPIAGLLPGLREGLQLVNTGGHLKLYVPAELGFGSEMNIYNPMPPGSTLIYTIELVELNPRTDKQAGK